ncbi:PAS domain S-box protein [Oculatella sp. LEGE 06141]|uniref:ATP-binding protein n=1 Tax=Oculatella sp. LEGE 06141 TaxID=1828648 RepID=UPI0018829D51|nr:ATP-binding protein [Oculatella sp. LEGE 06141]MBE9177256.1 PAS domain S-box protein [Oculatella sp. LEGE 06141]
MLEFLRSVFVANGFIPHGHCYLWKPELVGLHVLSDFWIGCAYVAISLTLVYLVRKAKLPFQGVFLAFGLFIASCGATHFMEILTLWYPVYWLSGEVKLITAIASVTTAILLPPLVPKVIALVQSAALAEERRLQLEAANQELETLYDRIKQLDQLKTQFFTNISHELRTPLALILGTTENLLAECTLAEEPYRDLDTVNRNAHILLKYVNDLLDMSKLEASMMELHRTEVDLAQLVRQTVSCFESFAAERKIEVVVNVPASLWVEVDAEKMERVLLNLLSNAFKFVPVDGKIQCRLVAGDVVTLAVEDNGSGVPVELQDVIFDRFQQGNRKANHLSGGTGLGLAIAKEFVELHHGQITVDEAAGGGAIFTVALPWGTVSEPVAAMVAESEGAIAATEPRTVRFESVAQQAIATLQTGMPQLEADGVGEALAAEDDRRSLVLVVEDNLDMTRLIAKTLGKEYRIVTAIDGEDGLEKALSLQPDLILTDIMMPQTSGDELVRTIRCHPELDTVPIILLTARASSELQIELLRSGAQDYLMKPFSIEELRVRVDNLLEIKHVRDVLQAELANQRQDVSALVSNVSLRKQELQAALVALQQSEARFRRVAESNMIGILFWNRNGDVLEANDTFLQTVGYTQADLKAGRVRWHEMTPPEFRVQDEQAFAEMAVQGVATPFEKEYIRQDGSRVPVLIGAALLEDEEDQGVAFVLDITQRKQTEAALQAAYDEMELRVEERTSELSQANARLQEQIAEREKAEAALRVSQESIQLLYEIVAAQHLSFSDKVQAILELGCDRFQCHLGILAQVTGLGAVPLTQARYEVIEVRSQPCASALAELPAIELGAVFELGDTFCRQTIEASKPLSIEHAGQTDEWHSHPCYLNTQLEAYIGTPIWVQGEVYGTLNFSSPTPRQMPFAAEDKKFLQLMAQWVGGEIARQRTEQALAQEREFLKVLLNTVNAGIVACNAAGILTLFNQAARDLHGLSEQPIPLEEWTQYYNLYRPDGKTPLPSDQIPLIRAWQGERVYNQEIVIVSQQGVARTLLTSGQAIVDAQGEKLGAVAVMHDISDCKRAEEQVQQLNAELEQRVIERTAQLEAANRAKDEFLATLSHELRTPLNAILGWAQLLRSRKLDEQTRHKALETIERNAKSQAQLVNDILDVSRIIRGKVRLNLRSFSLVAAIEAALDSVRPAATAKGIHIESAYDQAALSVLGDADRLQQVFWNLLSNAIKFTPEGGKVSVHLERVENRVVAAAHGSGQAQSVVAGSHDATVEYVRIEISDTGQGISPEFLPHVFDRFRQADGSISRAHNGLGLGLAIVRHLVELHGGTVQAHSPGEGQGATFSVILPLRDTLTAEGWTSDDIT